MVEYALERSIVKETSAKELVSFGYVRIGFRGRVELGVAMVRRITTEGVVLDMES